MIVEQQQGRDHHVDVNPPPTEHAAQAESEKARYQDEVLK